MEAEILIPDYLPQVFKIVKCFVACVVLQKQFSAGRLTVEEMCIRDRVNPNVPEGLAAITARAMAKDPRSRYPSAREMRCV